MPTVSFGLTQALLTGTDLETRMVEVSGLSGDTLSYYDDNRWLTQGSVAEYVRMIPVVPGHLSRPYHEAASQQRIWLVNGQSFSGQWTGTRSNGEVIEWAHPELGRFAFGLDNVRLLRLSSSSLNLGRVLTDPPDSDTVYFVNGDQITGFVITVSQDSVVLIPDGGDNEIGFPVSNIAAVQFANPPIESANEGDTVVLRDGSRFSAKGLNIQGDLITLSPTLSPMDAAVELTLNQVMAIEFSASGLKLDNLYRQPQEVLSGGAVFGSDWVPGQEQGGFGMHAPVTVKFSLPSGTQRFSTQARLNLPEGLPRERAVLADVELRVYLDGLDTTPIVEARLDAENPQAPINVVLEPGHEALIIELDPADNGPILDRVLLKGGQLLIEAPRPRPGTGDATR
ncbi:hypothetical protein [Algisphaera agarilytica]|uniref:Uncharacterized protein n=1 Tax=Algisphaera agarilytica TaxID=1385975 RepID=A0A7X0H885_9BACT|nr:hypothetical protein [Algisphaera agarilytica]MBB6429625.1 hypothetical protein [Algisphaera agarilytica]